MNSNATNSMPVEQFARTGEVFRQIYNPHDCHAESRFWQNGQLVLAAWQDKRPVHILSTLSQLGECDSVTRRERDGSQVSLSCPTAILTYTKYMGGVDLGDQLRKYYCVHIFWCMFDCCITNAFILSKFWDHVRYPTPPRNESGAWSTACAI